LKQNGEALGEVVEEEMLEGEGEVKPPSFPIENKLVL